jgi:hypothetical protein
VIGLLRDSLKKPLYRLLLESPNCLAESEDNASKELATQ